MSSGAKESIEDEIEPIGQSFMPATADDIRRIEEVVRGRLPPSYAAFLSRSGSSMFSGWATVKATNGEMLSIFTFFGGGGATTSVLDDLKAHGDYVAEQLARSQTITLVTATFSK